MPRRALLAAPALLALAARPARAEDKAQIRVGGTGAGLGAVARLAEELAASGNGPRVELVYDLGTRGSIRAVGAGLIDLSIAERRLNDEQRAAGMADRPFASTPLVLATHADTAADGLGSAEAVEMIAGRRRAWPDGTPVRITRRAPDDGDTIALAALSPAMAEAVGQMVGRQGLPTAGSDHAQATTIESVPGSLGTLAYALILAERRRIRPLALDGRRPDDPAWPMRRPLFLVARHDPDRSVQRLIAYLTDPAGAGRLAALGLTPAAAA